MITVTGTVTYNGQQVKSGVIKFLAPNGDFATAVIQVRDRIANGRLVLVPN